MKKIFCFAICLIIALAQISFAQSETGQSVALPAPATNITLKDFPNDNGHAVQVRWELSADDGAGAKNVVTYEIYSSTDPNAADTLWKRRGSVPFGTASFNDKGSRESESRDYLPKNTDIYYRIKAIVLGAASYSQTAGPVQAKDNWFNTGKTIVLFFVLSFALFMFIFLRAAKRGKKLYIRPLGGIDAIDEALGRATEMGKPILYVLGAGSASDIATIASFTVLGRVAKKVAEYQTSLIVPCYDPIVMTVAQEVVRTGYVDAGRPDAYDPEKVYFITQNQFAYVSAVMGTMLREKPATNFYLGKFYAESLLLAETGVLAGSIQISGTDEVSQLPFFVVACDYTLMGEELYAASAYLGREPLLLGTLKAQDWAKGLVVLSVVLGIIVRFAISNDFVRKIFEVT